MLYTVGEMAKVMGVPASTLRYYDNEGILPCVERSNGGIRMFTDKDYEWLKVVECLKKSGLSIKDIKAFTEMIDRGRRFAARTAYIVPHPERLCQKANSRSPGDT